MSESSATAWDTVLTDTMDAGYRRWRSLPTSGAGGAVS
jgi:hypothetical protein